MAFPRHKRDPDGTDLAPSLWPEAFLNEFLRGFKRHAKFYGQVFRGRPKKLALQLQLKLMEMEILASN